MRDGGVFNPPQNLEAFQCFLITFAIDMMDHKIRYDFLYDWAVNAEMFDP